MDRGTMNQSSLRPRMEEAGEGVSEPSRRNRFSRGLVALLMALATVLLLSCIPFIGGNGDEQAPGATTGDEQAGQTTPGPTATNTPSPPPPDKPTPTPPKEEPTGTPTLPPPLIQTADQALSLVWVHLSRCVSFEVSELETSKIQGDWFVKGSTGSATQVGLWRVGASTGDIQPYDLPARDWARYVEADCSPGVARTIFTPTPAPTPTSTPVSPPVVPDAETAVTALWAHLVKCESDLQIDAFQARWNPVNSQWVVTTSTGDRTDLGVWTVDEDGSISPDNRRALLKDQLVLTGGC